MADNLQHPTSGTAPSPTSAHRNPTQHPLSCTHCRQRKIKCDKRYPCSPCSRSNLTCVFPERARHPKKKPASSKATNDELMRRLGRMEELIEKMKVEGKDLNGLKIVKEDSTSPDTSRSRHTSEARSPASNGPDPAEDGMNRFIGAYFWRSLSSEVGAPLFSCVGGRPIAMVINRLANPLAHCRSKASRKQWTMTPTTKKILNFPANHQLTQASRNQPYSLDLNLFVKGSCAYCTLPLPR